MQSSSSPNGLGAATRGFYERALTLLREGGIPFLVGGAYAYQRYTSISRHTKDLDLFVKPDDIQRVLALFDAAGYRTELTSPVWLGKVFEGDALIDIIFSSGNGIARVDDVWFARAVGEQVLGQRVLLSPPEEMIWSKAYVMERDRYDGADIAHIIQHQGDQLDWQHLLQRFGAHWRVLLSHLVLFGFIYPADRDRVPRWVMVELLGRLQDEMTSPPPSDRICQGTLLARSQYCVDIAEWGYADARLPSAPPPLAGEVAQ